MSGSSRELSPMYSLVNGLLFGAHFMFAYGESAAPRYDELRFQMNRFLGEIGVEHTIPENRDEFLTDHAALGVQFRDLVNGRLDGAGAAMVLGVAAIKEAMAGEADLTVAQAIEMAGSDGDWLDTYQQALPQQRETSGPLLFAPALIVLRELASRLAPEPKSCFVAMPFDDEFERRYADLYRPMLEEHGRTPIRAWGNLVGEAYQSWLVVVLQGCGAVLADITGANANVMLEAGIGIGAGKPVYLVTDETERPSSNVDLRWVMPYDPSPPRNSQNRQLGELWIAAVDGLHQNGAAVFGEDSPSYIVSALAALPDWKPGDPMPPMTPRYL